MFATALTRSKNTSLSTLPLLNYRIRKVKNKTPNMITLEMSTDHAINLEFIELTFASEKSELPNIKAVNLQDQNLSAFSTSETPDIVMVVPNSEHKIAKLAKNTSLLLKITFDQVLNNALFSDFSISIREKACLPDDKLPYLRKIELEISSEKDKPLSILDANYFCTPALSIPLLDYQFPANMEVPLNVSAQNVLLKITVSANETTVNLKSITLILPVNTNTPQNSQHILTAASQIVDIKLTPDLGFSITSTVNDDGEIIIEPKNKNVLKQGDAFTISMTILHVDAQVGACSIGIQEVSHNRMDNDEQHRKTILTLNKFPRGFSLSSFDIAPYPKQLPYSIYANQPIKFSWKASVNSDLPITVELVTSENQSLDKSIDVTHMHEETIMPSIEEGEIRAELLAALMNENQQPWLIQSYLLNAPITLLKPKIKYLILSSNKVIPDSSSSNNSIKKIAVGGIVTLQWEKEGIFDYYELSFGDGRSNIKLPGNSLSYRDSALLCSTTYTLSGYLDAFPQQAQDFKEISMKLYDPKYTPALCVLQESDIATAQASLDGKKLYVASETNIQVFDLSISTSPKLVETLTLDYGVTAMALSPNNTLYVANQTRPKITAINGDDNTLLFEMDIAVLPQALLLSLADNNSPILYVAGRGKLMTINLSSQQTSEPIVIQATDSSSSQFQRISSLALASQGSLYISSTDSNVIKIFNTQNPQAPLDELSITLPVTDTSTPSQTLLKPRSLAISTDNTQLVIALAGINSVIKLNVNDATSQYLLNNQQCKFPESLIMTGTEKSLLCATTGSKSSVAIFDTTAWKHANTFDFFLLPLALDTRVLTASSDGTTIFVVCSNSIYSFWTQEKEIINQYAITPTKTTEHKDPDKHKKQHPKKPSSPPTPDLPPETFLDMAPLTPQGMEQLNARLEADTAPFSMFFPNISKNVEKNAPISVAPSSSVRFYFDPFTTTDKHAENKLKKYLQLDRWVHPIALLKSDPDNLQKIELIVYKGMLETEKNYHQRAQKIVDALKKTGLSVESLLLKTIDEKKVIIMETAEHAIRTLKKQLTDVTGLPWETEKSQEHHYST